MFAIDKDGAQVVIFGADPIEIVKFEGKDNDDEFKYAGVVLKEPDSPDVKVKLIFQNVNDIVALMQVLVKVGKSFPEPLIIPGSPGMGNHG